MEKNFIRFRFNGSTTEVRAYKFFGGANFLPALWIDNWAGNLLAAYAGFSGFSNDPKAISIISPNLSDTRPEQVFLQNGLKVEAECFLTNLLRSQIYCIDKIKITILQDGGAYQNAENYGSSLPTPILLKISANLLYQDYKVITFVSENNGSAASYDGATSKTTYVADVNLEMQAEDFFIFLLGNAFPANSVFIFDFYLNCSISYNKKYNKTFLIQGEQKEN